MFGRKHPWHRDASTGRSSSSNSCKKTVFDLSCLRLGQWFNLSRYPVIICTAHMFLKLVTDMSEKYRQTLFFLSFLVLFSLYGCFNSKPVRHLSSDVCLLIPNMTTKEEVLRLIGQPNQRLTSQQGQETWYYYNAKKVCSEKLLTSATNSAMKILISSRLLLPETGL